MGDVQDKQLAIQNIQTKIDTLKSKRAAKLAEADAVHREACRQAKLQMNAKGAEIAAEYDPEIADLEDQRIDAGGVGEKRKR